MTLHTKIDFQNLLRHLMQPLKPCYSPSGALLNLGQTSAHYPDRVAALEGFARPLWGLAPFWKGGGTVMEDFAGTYCAGLAAGTDPEHPDYWDAAGEVNQRYVEMAALAVGLLLTPEKLWEPLSEQEKGNVSRWLGKINSIDTDSYPDCNWWFFVVLTNLALRSLGQPFNQDMTEYAFERLETFYLGDGWYQDGMSGRKDYYVSFAIHFYSILYSVFASDSDPRRCLLFRERAEAFAQDYLYWFDDRGRAIPYGRSLTYRFAQAAFWSAYVYAGLTAVPLAVVKGLLASHLTDWASRPIFDRNGILTIGYGYPNLNMAETYNAPGSPYWAMKSFLVLALPDRHPFWSVVAAEMPGLDTVKHFPTAEMLIQRCGSHVTMYPSAVFHNDSFGHMTEKYGKFVYSTEFGFSVALGNGDIELAAPDSMLAFVYDGYIFTRRNAAIATIENKEIRSVWSPLTGIMVETHITLTEKGHIRRHIVTNELKDCIAYDCGFAVPAPAPDQYEAVTQAGRASARCGKAMCAVLSSLGEPYVIIPAPNTNLICSKTAIPSVRYDIPMGTAVLETEIQTEVS